MHRSRMRGVMVRMASGLVAAAVLTVGSPASAATTGPSLAVDGALHVHAIPDTIYGINWASSHLRSTLRLPVNRWGGNGTSLYNYTNDDYNHGNDWYFENQTGSDANTRLSTWLAGNASTATPSLVTVPMIGWVAKDGTSCAFPTSAFPNQDSVDEGRGCGNGVRGGVNLTATPSDFALATNSSWAANMVTWVGSRAHLYELDNEPGLWSDTHRDVHPNLLTHTEWWNKARPTAEAIKAKDPNAKIFAPSDDGYCRWLYDAADDCDPSGTNYQQTGDLAPWYVKQFKTYADANGGKRLLDYLDEHYYPQSDGVALTTSAGSPATQALRLRSTRSLWDPTYKDESWIGRPSDVDAPPLQFIRKLRSWAALYPGTKTAITEYNWGAMNSINGALAQADVLGIFGRERLDLATLWWNEDGPVDGSPVEWAFRIFRNYDGHGARFSSGGCHAASTDQGKLSVYAARNTTAMTIVVINKTGSALTSPLSLKNYAHRSGGRTYTLGPANPRAIVQKSLTIGSTGFRYTYPANSVTLVRIPHT